VELPSYHGDLINFPEFSAKARKPDPNLLLQGYQHAAMTLNFIRSLTASGFADLHHSEYWDLSFFNRAELPPQRNAEYHRMSGRIAAALRFIEAVGETSVCDLTRVDFFASHEGLNLNYESAQTRAVPRRAGHYDLTTHLPWIGDRTRALGGGHVEFFRGIQNPVGVKLGPTTSPEEVVALSHVLNPNDEPGKLVFITRMGASRVEAVLPALVDAIQRADRRVLWVSDPMHGNVIQTATGVKTRDCAQIFAELESSFDVHAACGSILGGVHLELTGDDVTECIGAGISVSDLDESYLTVCDPRLNYQQALEISFRIGSRMSGARRGGDGL